MDKKKRAGEKAAEFVQDGMVVGLGTGSTVYWAIRKLGELVNQGMRIQAIPTSEQTQQLALELGIPLLLFGQIERVDVTIDGADEIDPRFHLIKGGGGALFREKMVALASGQFIIVADDSKLVRRLGAFPLPVEIVPFGWAMTMRRLVQLGCTAQLRRREETPFVTDNGNWILDCSFAEITEPERLHRSLKMITGVVETGLFSNAASKVVVGTDSEVRIYTHEDVMDNWR